MTLLANHRRVGVIVPVAVSILMWALASGAFAVEPAPTGHRQPNVSNVPTNVLREENAIEAQDNKFDKELNICRGC